MKLHHVESNHQFEVGDKTGLLTGLTYTSPSGARGVGFATSLNINQKVVNGGLQLVDLSTLIARVNHKLPARLPHFTKKD